MRETLRQICHLERGRTPESKDPCTVEGTELAEGMSKSNLPQGELPGAGVVMQWNAGVFHSALRMTFEKDGKKNKSEKDGVKKPDQPVR